MYAVECQNERKVNFLSTVSVFRPSSTSSSWRSRPTDILRTSIQKTKNEDEEEKIESNWIFNNCIFYRHRHGTLYISKINDSIAKKVKKIKTISVDIHFWVGYIQESVIITIGCFDLAQCLITYLHKIISTYQHDLACVQEQTSVLIHLQFFMINLLP